MLHKIFTCHYSHIPEFILMLCVFSGSVFFSFLHKHTHTHTHQRTLAHLRWKNTSQPSNICCCSLFPHIWKLFFSRGINREMFGHEKKINATSEKLFANLMHARTLKWAWKRTSGESGERKARKNSGKNCDWLAMSCRPMFESPSNDTSYTFSFSHSQLSEWLGDGNIWRR